ncbi:hypothetical protein H6503_03545 [Candidatus Woesearchaeota archaeon]|nr:hypothetical protein [Candidatus Woesearchaeota archaeon]
MVSKNVFVKFSKVILIVLLFFILGEAIARYSMFGIYGFKPDRLESIVAPTARVCSDNSTKLTIFIPNSTFLFKGEYISVNSLGINDKEYNISKPDGTYRIILLGDSYDMNIGIKQEEVYHVMLEESLNNNFSKEQDNISFEILNFGGPGLNNHWSYNIGRLNGTLLYQPDVLLYHAWAFDLNILVPLLQWQNMTGIPVIFYTMECEDGFDLKVANFISENTDSIFITCLGIGHKLDVNNYVYPVNSHPNARIHEKYHDELYKYFIENFETITERYTEKNVSDIISSIEQEECIPMQYDKKIPSFWRSYFWIRVKERFIGPQIYMS